MSTADGTEHEGTRSSRKEGAKHLGNLYSICEHYERKWGDEDVSFKAFKKYYPGAHTEVIRPASLFG